MPDIKIVKFEKDNRILHFYYINDEFWAISSQIAEFFNITPSTFKKYVKTIESSVIETELFKSLDDVILEQDNTANKIKKCKLLNSNYIFAIGYKYNEPLTSNLLKWYSRIYKKLSGMKFTGLDCAVTGKGRIYVQFGEMEEAIFNTAVYFKNTYDTTWLQDPLVQKMIKSVDRAIVLDDNIIESFVLGKISPVGLSGGVKTLILMYKDTDNIFNASTCGDNCSRWILELAKNRNITINLRHIMDFGDKDFDIVILNNKKRVTNMTELVRYAGLYL